MEVRRCESVEELRTATAPIVHHFGRKRPDEAWAERWLRNSSSTAPTPGMSERRSAWWEHRLLADPREFRFGGGLKHYAVLEVDGQPEGYGIYRLNTAFGSLGPETKVIVVEALGATPRGTVSIWRVLLDVD
jgi:hypothetical protein